MKKIQLSSFGNMRGAWEKETLMESEGITAEETEGSSERKCILYC